MLKTFWHVNEFGESGWSHFPVIAALSEKLTLWAPSGIMLKNAFEKGLCPFSPNELIELIEDGKIKVAGRANWIEGKSWRSKPVSGNEFYGRAWLPGFDDEILKIYASSNSSEVLVLPDEEGNSWADTCAHTKNSKEWRIAKELFRSGLVPQGTRERIERVLCSGERHKVISAVKIIIRDSRNHRDALNQTGSHLPFEMGEFNFGKFNQLSGVVAANNPPTPERWSLERVLELEDTLLRLGSITKFDHLKRFIMDKRIGKELSSFIFSVEAIDKLLLERIKDEYEPIYSASQMLGSDDGWLKKLTAGSMFASLAGVIVTAWSGKDTNKKSDSKKMTRRQFVGYGGSLMLGVIGASGVAVPTVSMVERSIGVLPAGGEYTGPRSPFIYAYNTDSPTRMQVEYVIGKLGR